MLLCNMMEIYHGSSSASADDLLDYIGCDKSR